MNTKEYAKVKALDYRDYCAYLQGKYGLARGPYMTPAWNKNPKCSRTKEGLVCHHVYEDHAIMLSTAENAKNNPYTWQLPENLVYCDYLEHLLLHILICENPADDKNPFEAVGIGGVLNFIVPELNDYYSGFRSKQAWRQTCYDRVQDDRDTYFVLLERFIANCHDLPQYSADRLYSSFNEPFGLWSREKNREIFGQIDALLGRKDR